MTTLLALDPGKTTGMSWWYYDDTSHLALLRYEQIKGGLDGVIDELISKSPNLYNFIVCESFKLDGRTPNPDVTPLQIEGVLSYCSKFYGIPVVYQANNMKAHATDEFLKKHDLWFKGAPHATDSARHAIAYMKRIKHRPTLEHYFSQ
jgi:hypothetical protein